MIIAPGKASRLIDSGAALESAAVDEFSIQPYDTSPLAWSHTYRSRPPEGSSSLQMF